MSEQDVLERALRRVLWTLRPYLPDLVVIGGWVPHLYRAYGGFRSWQSNLSGTGEVDVLLPDATVLAQRPPLADVLRDAGFESDADGAVWANEPVTGEKIEFFVPHQGIAKTLGRPRAIGGQAGVGAIPLTDLTLLGAHTRPLLVPVTIASQPNATLTVRVPSLGAYVVAKASTFMKRPHAALQGGRSRRAKDLVYIRDVAAAGDEVMTQVERDIAEIRELGPVVEAQLDYARSQLLLLNEQSAVLREAAEELSERDAIPLDAALQDVRGHLADVREILPDSGSAS